MPATGVCPVMSSAQQSTVTCKGEKCHYWNREFEMCSEVVKTRMLEKIRFRLEDITHQLSLLVGTGDEDGT